jgi:hypothetical protein
MRSSTMMAAMSAYSTEVTPRSRQPAPRILILN